MMERKYFLKGAKENLPWHVGCRFFFLTFRKDVPTNYINGYMINCECFY